MLKQKKKNNYKRFKNQFSINFLSITYKNFTKFLNFGLKILGLGTGTGNGSKDPVPVFLG